MTTEATAEVRTSTVVDPGPPGVRRTASRSGRRRTTSVAVHAVLIAASAFLLYPLAWMVVSSLRPTQEIFRTPGLLLTTFEWRNYTEGWTSLQDSFSLYLWNSAVVVSLAIVGTLVSCSMAAYAFARMQFRFKRTFFALMLMTIMLPFHVVIVPQYILFNRLDWINTILPLVVPKFLAVDAFFVFLMVQFIRGIPREIDEAARIDGAGHARIFLQIMLPLMVPALATTAIFTFVWTWSDFFGALLYLNTPDTWTVPLALRNFTDSQGSSSFGPLFAMSLVSLVPVFLAFVFGQKLLIKGIATTGIK
ncbi:carbohydrate ABC transporter permease [Cellulomonas endophytica]|uniref:carbohydrate ABC transporter permease n=1 Tax=Cellulomonas endophytica TaxID=2494735 RepID=UPI0010138912|nr:carbohydrate ABC transporter permease [Cellulomonas endophytica]